MKKKASDGWIAIAVISCSIVLFIALAFGLTGRVFVSGGRDVRVRFPDVTGIKVSSQVKFAGAPAGAVSGMRMLTAQERAADPANLVEITLHLLPDVPPLTKNAHVSIAADTLLSDKFVLVKDASPVGTPALTGEEILVGIAPTTFDQLARNVDDAIEGLRKTLGGEAADNAKDLFSRVHQLVDQTQGLLTELKPVVGDAGSVMADARSVLGDAKGVLGDTKTTVGDMRTLLSENKDRIGRAITRLDSAAGSIESFAKKSESLVRDNEKNISSALAGLRVTSDNLKVTSTYSKFLLHNLAERPNRLIWGVWKPPTLPTEEEILKSRQPLPER